MSTDWTGEALDFKFKLQGYKMAGDEAVGLVVNDGFTLEFRDEDGNAIPLNKEAIDEFLKKTREAE